MPRLSKPLRAAAQYAVDLDNRSRHPHGSFDNAGRWYPDNELECCQSIRSPSRSWPHSLLLHCRTVKHVAAETKYSATLLRWAMARIRDEEEA